MSFFASLFLFAAVVDGTSEIVIADAPAGEGVVATAARELQTDLEAVLGAKLPIVSAPTGGKTALVLGDTAWSRAAGVSVADLKRDGYVVKTVGERIFIAGRDDPKAPLKRMMTGNYGPYFERGTWNGVIGFLEKYAGCRFYYPGEFGTILPRTARIDVPEGTWRDEPDFKVRYWSYWGMGRDHVPGRSARDYLVERNLHRLRLKMDTACTPVAHGQAKLSYPERFAKTHPEYFRTDEKGHRNLDSANTPNASYQTSQFCYTSGVWDELEKDAISYFRGEDASVRGVVARTGKGFGWNGIGDEETRATFDIMPQDGLGRCYCERCRRTLPEGPMWGLDLIWGKTAAIGRRLKDLGLKGTLVQMAYGSYCGIPDVELPDNIAVMVATRGPWTMSDKKARQQDLERIRGWSEKLHGNIWLWNYSGKFACSRLDIPDIPQTAPRSTGAYYKMVAPYVFGAYLNTETDYCLHDYLVHYVLSKVCWNVKTDVETLLAEHDRLMFGAAAAELGEYFRLVERKWVKEIAGNIEQGPLGPMVSPPTELDLWTKVYSPAVLDRMDALFASAVRKTSDGSPERRRVETVRRVFYEKVREKGRAFQAQADAAAAVRRNRDASSPNLLDDDKWFRLSDYRDTSVFLTAPDSLRLTTTNTTGCFYIFSGDQIRKLKPKTRYRISFCLKTDLRPLEPGGGAQVTFVGQDVPFVTYPSRAWISGKRDWTHHSFEVRTGAVIGTAKPNLTDISLRIRRASGSAWFDEVRMEELPDEDVPQRVLELAPGSGNTRNSEGDFVQLKDGSILYVYSHYLKGTGDDHDEAQLRTRLSRDGGRSWTTNSEVAVVREKGAMNVMSASFLRLKDGSLALFYLNKRSLADCHPEMRVSRDEGKTWSAPRLCLPPEAPTGYHTVNNSRVVRLSSGRIVVPLAVTHLDKDGKLGQAYALFCSWSDDEGRTWQCGPDRIRTVDEKGEVVTTQEPGVVELKDGRVLMFARTRHGQQWFYYSSDGCQTWTAGEPGNLFGPLAPAVIKRLSDGTLLAVWNDQENRPDILAKAEKLGWGLRVPLTLAISRDEGLTWTDRHILEGDLDAWFCYVAVLETDKDILLGYCAKDTLKYSRITRVPKSWLQKPDENGLKGFFPKCD